MKKSLRFRVLYGIILINAFFLLLSGGIILSSMWLNSEKNARELSGALTEEIKNSVATQTKSYFTPAKAVNQSITYLLYRYFTDPVNNPENKENLIGFYGEIMKAYPQFKMLYFSDAHGDLVMLNRMDDGSFSIRTVHNTGSEIHINWEHDNPAHYGSYPNTIDSAASGYDPRKRSWYQSAKEERRAIWTPVYLFATDHLPGFTCAVPVFNSAGEVVGVSSVDIAVNELSRFLGTLRPTPETKIFILDKANNLVALQATQESDLEKLFVESVDAQGYKTYNVTSISALQDNETRSLLLEAIHGGGESGLVEYQNEKYMTSLIPLAIGDGLDLIIAIIIPEDDIFGNVRRNLMRVTLFSIFILMLVLIANAFFSQVIARPMRILSEEMLKIKSFDLDSNVPINSKLLEIMDIP